MAACNQNQNDTKARASAEVRTGEQQGGMRFVGDPNTAKKQVAKFTAEHKVSRMAFKS